MAKRGIQHPQEKCPPVWSRTRHEAEHERRQHIHFLDHKERGGEKKRENNYNKRMMGRQCLDTSENGWVGNVTVGTASAAQRNRT